MNILIINDSIFGTVSHEDTLWSVLGKELPAETLSLSSFKGNLKEYIARKAPDVVISNSLLGQLPLPTGTKSVVILQDNFIAQRELLPVPLAQRIKRLFRLDFYTQNIARQRTALTAASRVVAVSEHVATSYGVTGEIIPIGVDTTLFKPRENKQELRKKYGIPLGDVYIFVGSSHTVKGYKKILAEAKNNPDIFYIFVLKDGASVRLPNVKVFNQVPQETLAELYACADRYIGRSLVETLWLAPIEAMLCNIPVDVTPVGIFAGWKPKNEHPREEALAAGLDRETMVNRWQKLLETV